MPHTEVVCHGDPSCQAPSVQRGERDQIPCRWGTQVETHIRAAPTLLGYHDSFSIFHVALSQIPLTTNAIPSTTVSREVHEPFSSLTFAAVAAKTAPRATTWTLPTRTHSSFKLLGVNVPAYIVDTAETSTCHLQVVKGGKSIMLRVAQRRLVQTFDVHPYEYPHPQCERSVTFY